MSIAAMSSLSSLAAPKLAPARAADGDFKTAGVGHAVKDSDGDYKANAVPAASPAQPTTAPAASAAASSSPAVQSALNNLQKGG